MQTYMALNVSYITDSNQRITQDATSDASVFDRFIEADSSTNGRRFLTDRCLSLDPMASVVSLESADTVSPFNRMTSLDSKAEQHSIHRPSLISSMALDEHTCPQLAKAENGTLQFPSRP